MRAPIKREWMSREIVPFMKYITPTLSIRNSWYLLNMIVSYVT